MSRTTKLMSSVTASVLLLGPIARDSGSLATAAITQRRKAPEQNAAIDKAAEAVLKALRARKAEADQQGKPCEPMSLDDILKAQPDLKHELAQKALDLLDYQGRVTIVAGTNTKEDPNKYTLRTGGEG